MQWDEPPEKLEPRDLPRNLPRKVNTPRNMPRKLPRRHSIPPKIPDEIPLNDSRSLNATPGPAIKQMTKFLTTCET